jgi:glycosyltransferase involved in cell wall biosynthesis
LICIPTFNRSELLARSLAIALDQCAGLRVEICVSNNASSDATAELLESLALRHSCLRFENRAQNIGIDRNILAAVRMAKGCYVLPIGDDEILAPEALTRILHVLRSEPDLLILNGRYVTKGVFSAPRLPSSCRGVTVTSLFQSFALFWDQMPLGGFVARRGYADPHFADRYLGTHHAYSGAAWDFLLDRFNLSGRVSVVSLPDLLIEFHRVEKAWAADSGAIHFEQIPRWFDLIPKHYSAAVSVARREFRRRCSDSAQLVHFRAEGQISLANVGSYFRQFGFFARLRAYAAALLPADAAAAAVHAARWFARFKAL